MAKATKKPAKGSKSKKSNKRSLLSGAADDAEGGGLPEGRVRISNTHTAIRDWSNPDGDTIAEDAENAGPYLSFTCTPVDKKKNKPVKGAQPFNCHASAGNISRIVPDDDPGVGFVPAEDSKAKGLSRSSNASLFLKSLEDAGFPKKVLAAGDYTVIDGAVVDLVRLPQPKRRGLAADDEESGDGETYEKTYAAVSTIHVMPEGLKKGKATPKDEDTVDEEEDTDEEAGDEDEEEADSDDDDAEEEDEDADSESDDEEEESDDEADDDDSEEDADEDEDDETVGLAEKFGKKALSDPKVKKKGVEADALYETVFPLVKTHKQRKEIMAHFKDAKWAKSKDRPWSFDKKTERFKVA